MINTWRFHLRGASPTQINLSRYLLERGWSSSHFAWQAHFSTKHLNFSEEAAQCLEFKHLLARLVNQYCPHCMMTTYTINDDNWPAVINTLAKEFYQTTKQVPLQWILKPSLLNNGQHIKVFQNIDEIEAHFSQPNRLGGEHVLQRYINKPHLLRDERKYSIRLFLVVTNYSDAFLYHQGYFNVAMHQYTPTQFTDLRPHLTNEHLSHDEANVIQIPSDRFAHFPELFEQIKSLTSEVIKGLRQQFPQAFVTRKTRQFALFGVDAMVDSTGRAWLLEFNHGPCFPTDDEHPLQKYLYRDFWQALIDNFVMPIAHGSVGFMPDGSFVGI